MLEYLKKKNPELPLFDVRDQAFITYGRVINDFDGDSLLAAAKKIAPPESGSSYLPSVEALEELPAAEEIKNKLFGSLPTQGGSCCGPAFKIGTCAVSFYMVK